MAPPLGSATDVETCYTAMPPIRATSPASVDGLPCLPPFNSTLPHSADSPYPGTALSLLSCLEMSPRTQRSVPSTTHYLHSPGRTAAETVFQPGRVQCGKRQRGKL